MYSKAEQFLSLERTCFCMAGSQSKVTLLRLVNTNCWLWLFPLPSCSGHLPGMTGIGHRLHFEKSKLQQRLSSLQHIEPSNRRLPLRLILVLDLDRLSPDFPLRAVRSVFDAKWSREPLADRANDARLVCLDDDDDALPLHLHKREVGSGVAEGAGRGLAVGVLEEKGCGWS